VRVSFGMILPVSTFPFSLCSTLQAIIASVPARQAMLAQKKATEAASKAAGYVYTHTSAHTHIISLTHTCSLVHMRMHMHMNIHMHMHMLAQHILAFCMPASAFSCSCVPHFVIAAVTNRVYSNFHVLALPPPPLLRIHKTFTLPVLGIWKRRGRLQRQITERQPKILIYATLSKLLNLLSTHPLSLVSFSLSVLSHACSSKRMCGLFVASLSLFLSLSSSILPSLYCRGKAPGGGQHVTQVAACFSPDGQRRF